MKGALPHVQLCLFSHPLRVLHVRICRHRGRESVLHLPGDVRGGVPEGVGAGGEVGVCGRQDHHHALQGQPAIPAARAEFPLRSGPERVERAAQHREGGQSGGTYGAQRVGGGCSVQPAGAVRFHPVGGLLLRHGLCGALL